MKNLYFQDNSLNKEILIKENVSSKEEILKLLVESVKKKDPDYEIFYIRSWANEKMQMIFDFGSHTDFFIWK